MLLWVLNVSVSVFRSSVRQMKGVLPPIHPAAKSRAIPQLLMMMMKMTVSVCDELWSSSSSSVCSVGRSVSGWSSALKSSCCFCAAIFTEWSWYEGESPRVTNRNSWMEKHPRHHHHQCSHLHVCVCRHYGVKQSKTAAVCVDLSDQTLQCFTVLYMRIMKQVLISNYIIIIIYNSNLLLITENECWWARFIIVS